MAELEAIDLDLGACLFDSRDSYRQLQSRLQLRGGSA